MRRAPFNETVYQNEIGQAMYRIIMDLYPICRSITGDGFRQTLRLIQQYIPVTIHEVPSGTKVLDWTVPLEWNIKDAYIKNQRGQKIVDFHELNLHVVSYSRPICKKVPLHELKQHLFSLPDHPDWVPYRTSYYKENWGFCISQKQLMEMQDEEYDVCIDTSLKEGHLTYGECFLPGKRSEEILISCHACHPSLCNDNLSGIALAVFLAKALIAQSLHYSCRFLFIPGTIGSITWLAQHEADISKIKHGFVLTGVGDSGHYTYKKSRRGNAEVDEAFIHVLKHSQQNYKVIDFFPYGYDERQYCSPAFNMPIGCFMRTPHGKYEEYHTSADNLDFVQPQYLEGSFVQCLSVLNVLQKNRKFINLNPKGEPQLGKRGLYRAIGGQTGEPLKELALLWVLNLSDGKHSLLDIAERSGLKYGSIQNAADILIRHELIKELGEEGEV
jgi:aminopeptidase-like protein